MYKLLSGVNPWLLALVSGLLMALGWPMHKLSLVVFIAWIPLLIASDITKSNIRFFLMTYMSMLVWNALTTWWVWNASPAGALGAMLVNSLLMTIPWLCFRATSKYLGKHLGGISLIVFWLSWEYFHFNWQLSWPWLTLGHALSMYPSWVYWYSITGVAGGSAWIVAINVAVARAIRNASFHGENTFQAKTMIHFLPPGMLKITPLLLSFIMRPDIEEGQPAEVVVVQPNVEAYTEKFSTPPEILLNQMIRQSANSITPKTRLVVWPETALVIVLLAILSPSW